MLVEFTYICFCVEKFQYRIMKEMLQKKTLFGVDVLFSLPEIKNNFFSFLFQWNRKKRGKIQVIPHYITWQTLYDDAL